MSVLRADIGKNQLNRWVANLWIWLNIRLFAILELLMAVLLNFQIFWDIKPSLDRCFGEL